MPQETREKLSLIIVLILIAVFSCYYIRQKQGFYVDEGMTLYLSNGTYTGAVTTVPEATVFDFANEYVLRDSLPATISNVKSMLDDVVGAGDYSVKGTVEWYDAARSVLQGQNTWMDGTELYDMCTASKDDRFNYAQVYINQMMDVHPCVYYFIVHTVFSLFPGVYSDYFLFGINLVCLLVTCVLMYKMCRKMGMDPAVSLLGIAIYGFSQGFVSCAVFFRMYAMETLFVFLTFYCFILFKEKDYELTRKDRILLGFIEIVGFNVHYYYIIYLASMFAVVLADMIKKKKKVRKYILSHFVTGIISLIIWPFSLYHILFGYRGTEAFSRLTTFGLIRSITDYIKLCVDSLMFGWAAAGAFIILCAAWYVSGKIRGIQTDGSGDDSTGPAIARKELVIPMAVYLIVVGKVAPSDSARYVMCLFPLLTLCISIMTARMLGYFVKDENKRKIVCVSLGLIYAVCSFAFKQPDYLYPEYNRELGVNPDRQETNCLMIASEHYKGFPYMLKLAQFDQVMVVDAGVLDTINETRPAREKEDMIVYIDNTLDKEKILTELDKYGYLTDRKTEAADSDLVDFAAYYLSAER